MMTVRYQCPCGATTELPPGLPRARVGCRACTFPTAKLMVLVGILPVDLIKAVAADLVRLTVPRPLNLRHLYTRCHVCRRRNDTVRLRPTAERLRQTRRPWSEYSYKVWRRHPGARTHACDDCIAAGAVMVPRGWGLLPTRRILAAQERITIPRGQWRSAPGGAPGGAPGEVPNEAPGEAPGEAPDDDAVDRGRDLERILALVVRLGQKLEDGLARTRDIFK